MNDPKQVWHSSAPDHVVTAYRMLEFWWTIDCSCGKQLSGTPTNPSTDALDALLKDHLSMLKREDEAINEAIRLGFC